MMLSRRSLHRLRYQHDADIASWLTNKSAASGKYREASLSFNKSEQHPSHDNLKVCKFLSEKHQSYPQGGADPNGNHCIMMAAQTRANAPAAHEELIPWSLSTNLKEVPLPVI
jgi:hypothetical protein